MTNEERNTRWESLMALQEGLDADAPAAAAPISGRPRRRTPSTKAAAFGEALSASTTWNGFSDARHRRRAA
jgi:hypothetical protein